MRLETTGLRLISGGNGGNAHRRSDTNKCLRQHLVLRFLLTVGLAIGVSLSIAPIASAQAQGEVSQRSKDQAREHATKGIELFHKGRFADALDSLRRAESLYPAPTHRVYLARCLAGLGRLVEAKQLYVRIRAEPRTPDLPPAVLEAYVAAEGELIALGRRIATANITVMGAEGDAELSVDGKVQQLPRGPIEIDPGSHVVTVTESGRRAEHRFTVAEGATVDVRLELETTVEQDAPGSLLPAAITFGIGGVATVVGAVTGGVSFAKVDDLKDRCVDGHCPASDREEADVAGALGTASTVSFAVAGAAVATGIILAIVRPGGGADATSTTTTAQPNVVPILGAGYVGVAGTF